MGRATPTPRPSKVPSFKYLSRTVFSTGECSAAQAIFLWPSGASAGSLTMDSCIQLPSGLRFLCFSGHRLLDGLHLLTHTEHEAADDDEQEERDDCEPYAQVPRSLSAETEEQPHE